MNPIEPIKTMLVEMLGPLGPIYALGILGVVIVIVALPVMLKKTEDPLDRLKGTGGTAHRQTREKKAGDPRRQLRTQNKQAEKLDKFANFLEPQDEEEYSATRLKLLRAGYRDKSSVRAFHFAQFALGLAFLFLGVLYAVIASATGEINTQKAIISILVPGAIGYYLPKYWVDRRVGQRQDQIINGFPDSLDMMLVCVEAGQSLDQAIIRVSKEIRAGFPALADEYEMVAYEMKAGKDRVQVLKDMGERCGVMDVSSFVTVLVQSATFGTSIADALRVYASEMRDKRVMRAEEKANKLPTKLTLGTMMFTLPPLLVILIGPSVYKVAQMTSMASN